MTARILVGDCREHMAEMDAESVDAIVTDPPYDLTSGKRGGSGVASINLESPYGRARIGTGNGAGGFMGMAWDGTGVAFDPETWQAALRVLKPGGHLLAFGGTRTFHRMTVAIEDAGFEIRDCLSWLYGSGFPKSLNLDGEMAGWGTALKPAWEPIIVARKPLIGTVAANVTTHGTGALNIDGCRMETAGDRGRPPRTPNQIYGGGRGTNQGASENNPLGRWPANVVLDEDAAAVLDAQSGERSAGGKVTGDQSSYTGKSGIYGVFGRIENSPYGDTGGASRFFYVAKADRSERNKGLEGMAERTPHPDEPNGRAWDIPGSHSTARANHHPTVKPVSLMQWLVRLITPKGGTVLDPFMGSGTTGIAADREGDAFIGIEISGEYAEIARRRLVGDAPMFANVSLA